MMSLMVHIIRYFKLVLDTFESVFTRLLPIQILSLLVNLLKAKMSTSHVENNNLANASDHFFLLLFLGLSIYLWKDLFYLFQLYCFFIILTFYLAHKFCFPICPICLVYMNTNKFTSLELTLRNRLLFFGGVISPNTVFSESISSVTIKVGDKFICQIALTSSVCFVQFRPKRYKTSI